MAKFLQEARLARMPGRKDCLSEQAKVVQNKREHRPTAGSDKIWTKESNLRLRGLRGGKEKIISLSR